MNYSLLHIVWLLISLYINRHCQHKNLMSWDKELLHLVTTQNNFHVTLATIYFSFCKSHCTWDKWVLYLASTPIISHYNITLWFYNNSWQWRLHKNLDSPYWWTGEVHWTIGVWSKWNLQFTNNLLLWNSWWTAIQPIIAGGHQQQGGAIYYLQIRVMMI